MSIVSSIFAFYDFSYTRSNTLTFTFLPRYGPYLDLSDDIILVVVDVLTVLLFFCLLVSMQLSRDPPDNSEGLLDDPPKLSITL